MIYNSCFMTQKNKGFSLIEILVAVAVLVAVAALTAAVFSSFYRVQTLNSAIEQAISLIKEARSKTLSSEGASQYGVHFESSRLVLFKGSGFTEGNPDNKEFVLQSAVEIYDISLNGGVVDLVFKRLTGETNEYGGVFFRLKASPSKTRNIIIESSGLIGAD